MISHPLFGDYLRWLTPQIREEHDGNPNRTYEDLCAIMYEKEFVWHVPNDGNRKADGLDLRVEFCRERNLRGLVDHEVLSLFLDKDHPIPPCSFLEVLIGLSRRLEFAAGGSATSWAWELMTNLTLHRLGDPVGRSRAQRANEILDRVIWRSYDPDGRGGFFPLARPDEDQRKVELWYQMAAYIDEIYRAR